MPILPISQNKNGEDRTYSGNVVSAMGRLTVPRYSLLPPVAVAGSLVYVTATAGIYVSDGTAWVAASILPVPLQEIAALGSVPNQILYTDGAGAYQFSGSTAAGRAMMAAATAAAQRTLLNVSQTSPPASIPGNDGSVAIWDTSATPAFIGNSGANVVIDPATGDTGIAGDLTLMGNLDGITPSERAQLTTIGATTISAAQWGYLGAMNQGVATTDAPTFTGLDANSQRITSVGTPTAGSDATNKTYVDNLIALVDRTTVATTTDLSLENGGAYGVITYANGAQTLTATNNGALVLDAYTPTVGQRVLVKNQTVVCATAAPPNVTVANTVNGIYTLTTVGTGANPWVLTRASDFDIVVTPISASTIVFVDKGAIQKNLGWTLRSVVTTLDNPPTDPVIWDPFYPSYAAGNGILIAGNTISADPHTGITVDANGISITAPVATALGGTGSVGPYTNGQVVEVGGGGTFATNFAAAGSAYVGISDTQALTNKTIIDSTNSVRATLLAAQSAIPSDATITINTQAAPTAAGDVLTINGGAGLAWTAAWASGNITGGGTATRLPVWTGATSLGDSNITTTGTNLVGSGGNLSLNGVTQPTGGGVVGQVPILTAPTVLGWGDFVPALGAASTDNALVRWNGAGGNAIQNSLVVLGDTGDVTGIAALTTTGLPTLAGNAYPTTTGTANYVLATNGAGVLSWAIPSAWQLAAQSAIPSDTTITINTQAAPTAAGDVLTINGGAGLAWTAAWASGNITGGGTATRLPVWTGATSLGDSNITTTGTNLVGAGGNLSLNGVTQPTGGGVVGQVPILTAPTVLGWGDFVPALGAASTDNALVRWNGAGGNAIQNSLVILGDTGDITGIAALTTTGLPTLAGNAYPTTTGTANYVLSTNGAGVLSWAIPSAWQLAAQSAIPSDTTITINTQAAPTAAGDVLTINGGAGLAWTAAWASGNITGGGTATRLPVWTGATTLGDSNITTTGTNLVGAGGNLSLNGVTQPTGGGVTGQVPILTAPTVLGWGDFVPTLGAASTDNALVRWDGIGGAAIQNSVAVLTDAGVVSGLTGLTSTGAISLDNQVWPAAVGGGAGYLLRTDGATPSTLTWVDPSASYLWQTTTESSQTVLRPQGSGITNTFCFGVASPYDTDTEPRIFFDRTKAAIRAGQASGGEWTLASIGTHSVAFGNNNTGSGTYSLAGGGGGNVASGSYATISGGLNNTATDIYTAVGGGRDNDATNDYSTVSGGYGNVASGQYAAVGGGMDNTADDTGACVPGGRDNVAGGIDSVACGANCSMTHNHTWGFCDGTEILSSNNANRAFFRTHDGCRWYTATGISTGVRLSAGSTSWSSISSRDFKKDIVEVDYDRILGRVMEGVRVYTYRMKSQTPDEKWQFLGTMSQEFATIYDSGKDDTVIDRGDASGVNLALCIALRRQQKTSQERIDALEARVDFLEKSLRRLLDKKARKVL